MESSDPSHDRRAAVLGSPIAHSLSPVLHRAGFAALHLSGWSYDAYDVDESGLRGFIEGVDHSWAGLSLTMPLKRAVIPLLDSMGTTAEAVHAVNTVLFRADGSRHGDNTDVPGLVNALAEHGMEKVEAAAVLGAGATASSALAAVAEIATGRVDVYIRNRARDGEVRALAERLGMDLRLHDWSDATTAFGAELVVATTPAGATDGLAVRLPSRLGTLFDVLYHPWPTPFAAAWSAAGGEVIGGLELLVHQAALQFAMFTGKTAPLVAMRAAGEAALAAR